MNFFTSIATEYKNWETFTTSRHNIDTIILGMETLEKSQDGKIGATVRYEFYYRENMELLQPAEYSPNLANVNICKNTGQVQQPSKPST